ncbi:predicted protein [Verticillium alfalfae VaMs.102]|uniref:Predicted protein n=1 Tax=Verticillium alfalfae (strain VaMs.102 / ATCC MYA-4576 / FGSC 10136) TaxID=526221 RepID=C9S706_VERA1|nr:predicted protein [Verticillium alfalfae VaMs.102]EEY14617.1 predicted protein [Verticillium alfalfae VaMs.102]
MDLPKGFVEDDKRIYGKVANLNHLSLDVIRQFWQADSLPPHVPEPSRNGEPASVKELSASSSRPPPPHPILKKSRGDSKSGPRPTARFVSPPSSDEDECKSSEEVSSSSTATSGLDMRAPSNAATSSEKSSKKKAAAPTKRFVASSTASKRRPLLARRQSSQSSAGSSEPHPKAGSSAGSRFSGSQQGSVTSNPDRASAQTTPDSHPNDTMLSAKAFGKKPVVQPNPAVTVANQNHRHHQIQSPARQPLPKPTQALPGGPRSRMPDDFHGSPRKGGFSPAHSGRQTFTEALLLLQGQACQHLQMSTESPCHQAWSVRRQTRNATAPVD